MPDEPVAYCLAVIIAYILWWSWRDKRRQRRQELLVARLNEGSSRDRHARTAA